jgi:HlyD family type I secretion membrane fusion protein
MQDHKEKKNSIDENQEDLIEVLPVESPSENYLVLEHLRKMPNIFARGLVYLALLLLVTVFVFSIFCHIDVIVECQAVVRPSSHKAKIFCDSSGYIDQVYIYEGQKVQVGDPLFSIRSHDVTSIVSKIEELHNNIPLKRDFFDTKISAKEQEKDDLGRELQSLLSTQKLKLNQNDIRLKSIESDIEYWQKETQNLEEEYNDTKRLFDRHLSSIAEYNNIKSRWERALTEVEKLFAEKKIIFNENSILQSEIENSKATFANRRETITKEITSLQIEKESLLRSMAQELALNQSQLALKGGSNTSVDAAHEQKHIVVANKSGTVSELYLNNNGEYVRESDLLCTIIPEDSPFYMEIAVANKDIGFIEKGLEVKYKIDTFTHTDYGVLTGKVVEVSPSAVESQDGLRFHVKGDIDRPFFMIKDKKYFLKAGMSATAELITEKKTLLSIIFSKLNQ